jgi:hypothetical protein
LTLISGKIAEHVTMRLTARKHRVSQQWCQ